MKSEMYICPDCGAQVTREDPLDLSTSYCQPCREETRVYVHVVLREAYNKEKEMEERRKRIYCRNCQHIGLIEEFPFDAPPEDVHRERRCPKCGSDDGINFGDVTLCEKCGEAPAEKGDIYCQYCRNQYEMSASHQSRYQEYEEDE